MQSVDASMFEKIKELNSFVLIGGLLFVIVISLFSLMIYGATYSPSGFDDDFGGYSIALFLVGLLSLVLIFVSSKICNKICKNPLWNLILTPILAIIMVGILIIIVVVSGLVEALGSGFGLFVILVLFLLGIVTFVFATIYSIMKYIRKK